MKQKNSGIRWYHFLIVVLAIIAIGTVFISARYIKNTIKVKNIFTPASSVTPEIDEDFDNEIKKDVKINVGDTDYDVYVRAEIVITWKDKAGTVYYSIPTEAKPIYDDDDPETIIGYDGDYTMELNLSNDGWVKGNDGYYYYTKPVASGQDTDILIKECKPVNPGPDGYTLSVEIIAQTIQAAGTTDDDETPAYQDAWKYSFETATETPEEENSDGD